MCERYCPVCNKRVPTSIINKIVKDTEHMVTITYNRYRRVCDYCNSELDDNDLDE